MSISFERLKLHWTCLENGEEGGHEGTEEFLRVREIWLSLRGVGSSKRNSSGHNGDVSPAPPKKKPRKASAAYERCGLVGDEDGPSDDDDDDDDDDDGIDDTSEDEEGLLGGEDAAGLPRSTQYDLQDLDVSGSKACRTLEEVDDQWANRFRLYVLRVQAYKLGQEKKISRLREENESLKVENSELETRCSALQLRCESLRKGQGRSGKRVLNERDENHRNPVTQDVSAECEACGEEQRRLGEENESLMAANSALQTQCDEAIRVKNRLERIAGNHKAAADDLEDQLDASRERARRLLKENTSLRAALQEEEDKVQQLRRGVRNESCESQQGKVVQDLQQIVTQMQARQQEEESSLREDKRRMAQEIESLKDKLRDCQFHHDKSKAEVDRLQLEFGTNASQPTQGAKLDSARLDLQEKLTESTLQLETARLAKSTMEEELTAVSAQLRAARAELTARSAQAKANLDAKSAEINNLKFEMSVLKLRAEASSETRSEGEEDDAVLKARIADRDTTIRTLQAALREGEEIRRQLHNRIQALRGNIRVVARVRPFLPGETQRAESAIEVSGDGETLSIVDSHVMGRQSFAFNKVFGPSAGQEDVFAEVSDFVQSALDGYQVCLFSYGQTGSGKTHTMQGTGDGLMRGIVPRAVETILHQVAMMRTQGWKFDLAASFLEIYNDQLKDLQPHDKNQATPLAIRRDKSGKIFVEGLLEYGIDTLEVKAGMDRLKSHLEDAARARSVARTDMNARSSRSHFVVRLCLDGTHHESGTRAQGSLSLCDLAGSERLGRSGSSSDPDRLRETQAINTSLTALGQVFRALYKGRSHVPYRDSKLTHLLQDCLSGDGKSLMVVNLSPTPESAGESLSSLRFAQSASQVELGRPAKALQYSGGP